MVTLNTAINLPKASIARSGANADITSMTALSGVLQAPTFVNDSAGLHILGFNSTASAVNYLTMKNNSTTNYPQLAATGTDGTVGLDLVSKGGIFQFYDVATPSGTSAALRIYAGAGKYVELKSPPTLSANLPFILPSADAAGALVSDGSGNLSFTTTFSTSVWTDFSGSIGYTGFSGTPTTNLARYKQVGKILFFAISMTGTSNATGFTITGMPVAAARTLTGVSPVYQAVNNGSSNFTVQFSTNLGSTTLTMILSNNASGWTNTGTKAITFEGYYECQ